MPGLVSMLPISLLLVWLLLQCCYCSYCYCSWCHTIIVVFFCLFPNTIHKHRLTTHPPARPLTNYIIPAIAAVGIDKKRHFHTNAIKPKSLHLFGCCLVCWRVQSRVNSKQINWTWKKRKRIFRAQLWTHAHENCSLNCSHAAIYIRWLIHRGYFYSYASQFNLSLSCVVFSPSRESQ